MYWFLYFTTNDMPRPNKLNWHNYYEVSYCTPLTFLLASCCFWWNIPNYTLIPYLRELIPKHNHGHHYPLTLDTKLNLELQFHEHLRWITWVSFIHANKNLTNISFWCVFLQFENMMENGFQGMTAMLFIQYNFIQGVQIIWSKSKLRKEFVNMCLTTFQHTSANT